MSRVVITVCCLLVATESRVHVLQLQTGLTLNRVTGHAFPRKRN